MKYYIIAGEASGDLHSSNLIKELKNLDADAQFRGWGGDLMMNEGVELVRHYKDIAYMGFVEVIIHLREIFKNIEYCKKDILQYKPDALILVDYPGFNLKISEFAKQHNLKVFYYISPQVWAWKKHRVKLIKRSVDKMFIILPFEKDFYRKFDYDVEFVGHPLLDAIDNYKFISKSAFLEKHNLEDKPIIALLPGSRKQEIIKILGPMLTLINYFKDYQFVIAGVSSNSEEFYKSIYKLSNIRIIYNQTYSLLSYSTAAIVASGTATLEAALFEVPEVVCYKANMFSYWLARILVNVKYISLVNLIMDKKTVNELIQNDFNTKSLKNEIESVLLNDTERKLMIEDYKLLKQKLGGQGASMKVARSIFDYINTVEG